MSKSVRLWVVVVGASAALGTLTGNARGATQAGGGGHVVLQTPRGLVWSWGKNSDGQLGVDTPAQRRVPGPMREMGTITAVAAGASHSMALDKTGRVWVWGDNHDGQLGDGTTVDKKGPVKLALTSVTQIAAGGQHSMALRSTGELFVWGRNTSGQLGLGHTTSQTSPVLLMRGVTAMAGGLSHTVFVKADGTAWATGLNTNGQLGDDSTTQRTAPVQMRGVTSAAAVAAGNAHSLVRRRNGTLLATGQNIYGQLGDGSSTQRLVAVAVPGLTTASEIAAGEFHSVARLADGTLRAWGYNKYGQLGDGTQTNRPSPVTVSGLAGIARIGAGGSFTLAVSSTGVVYTWGSNANGEQGDGTSTLTSALLPHAISDANYDWKVATPKISVNGGTYFSNQFATVTNVMTDVDMHYTTTGSEPTLADPTIASGAGLSIAQSQTLKVKAWKSPMPVSDTVTQTYTLQVTAPWPTPGGTTYGTPQSVTLSTTTTGASIRYTTDGSTPTANSTLYAEPIPIHTRTVLKAIGVKTGWTDSIEMSATYDFHHGTPVAPTVDPAADRPR